MGERDETAAADRAPGGATANRLTGAVVGGHSLQIGEIHGNLSVVTRTDGTLRARRGPEPVRVRDADPLRLGVHRPIRRTGAAKPSLPGYVPRDLDTPEGGGLRDLIGRAADHGGFVLLVGGSSVGKTRSLYEAVRDRLPDWWLVHPADTGQIEQLLELPSGPLVLWLDELQNHLAGEHGLTAATLRALTAPPRRVLVVATLWPDYYDAYTAPHTSPKDGDRHRTERELLKLAEVVHVPTGFTTAERERAQRIAATDERLRTALESTDFGLTQVIAGAPQLTHRWESAGPYARAVLTTAADLTVLGAQSALPEALLRSAVPGHCTPAERAAAPADWFEEALTYVTRELLGATAPLRPASDGQEMGRPDGYRMADYLVQHIGRERRATPPPQSFWDACAEHLRDPADAHRVGASAVARQRFGVAVPLLRRAVEAGSVSAMETLGSLYRTMGDEQGRQEMAHRLAASAHTDAPLYRTVLAGWDFEELLDLADAGNEYAIGHLVEYGDPQLAIALLIERIEPDDLWSWKRLAELFHDEGDDERAIAILEMLVEKDHDEAIGLLAELLQQNGHLARLGELTDEGYFAAAYCLADTLQEMGRPIEAELVLEEFAGEGYRDIDAMLADLLVARGDFESLLERAEDGDADAAVAAAKVLRSHGEADRAVALLAGLADEGEVYAASTLAAMLRECEDEPRLRARAAGGDEWSARELVRLLLARGEVDEAIRRCPTGDRSHSHIVDALVAHGDVDGAVRLLMDRSDDSSRLRRLLKEHGRADDLRVLIDRGDRFAADDLADLLTDQGKESEARALRTHGLTPDGRLADTP
ncbi:tetratricopeptide repeat protein [Streptomyces sp. CA-210063]|uniref:tetratricopeptide repeat protein n=1 Tax=Streptomyces sp. CA-210063 TaxID=2801029 RepID=UPI00214C9375|nr:tetratricopeptide repeat protein [Streptomyces sp. CA-210063]UUU30630.1 tetratricopeptide repeat protein [Streptomyces sp. CA-210063]